MSELEDKINAVLGDPKQMEQITKLAKSFMGGGTPGKAAEPEPKGEEDPFASLGIDGATLQRLGRLLRQGGAESPRSGPCWRPCAPISPRNAAAKWTKQ